MNFKVTSRSQDSNGKHTTALLGDNGDTVVVTSADYFDDDVCSFQVHPPNEKVSEVAQEATSDKKKKAKSAE